VGSSELGFVASACALSDRKTEYKSWDLLSWPPFRWHSPMAAILVGEVKGIQVDVARQHRVY